MCHGICNSLNNTHRGANNLIQMSIPMPKYERKNKNLNDSELYEGLRTINHLSLDIQKQVIVRDIQLYCSGCFTWSQIASSQVVTYLAHCLCQSLSSFMLYHVRKTTVGIDKLLEIFRKYLSILLFGISILFFLRLFFFQSKLLCNQIM